MDDAAYAAERILAWRNDPGLFVRQAIGATPEPWQGEAWDRLRAGKRRVSIRSGHGVGKTFFLASTAIWFGTTRQDAKIPCTAPSAHQLSDLLWGEISICQRKMAERVPAIAALIDIKADQVAFGMSGSAAFARTSRKDNPEALQGFHAKHLMFLIDEASGIDDKIFEVAEGALSTEGAIVILAGNPTRTSGYFHRSHNSARDRWSCLRVGSSDSSRVSADYVAGMAADYGVDSDIYRVRVLGDFPSASADAVIGLDLVEAAVHRDIMPGPVKSLWGVDVARFGDDATALAKRRGTVLTEKVKVWRNKDTMQVAGLVKAEWDATADNDRPAEILVDVIGLGAGVVDRLKELDLPVRGVNVAEAPSVDDRYSRLRDELWFKAREWFAERACRIPDDEGLIGELTGPRYAIVSSGLIKVESKDEMKKRGVRSPDRADAFCLTFAGSTTATAWATGRKKLDYSSINKGIT